MRYIGIALAAEGPTDDEFLAPVLERAVEEAARQAFDYEVILGTPFIYRTGGPPNVEELVDFATGEGRSFELLVFHRDCGAKFSRVNREWFKPFEDELASREACVGWVKLCPRKETESWMLADIAALRSVTGVTWSDEDFGFPSGDVESVVDPKLVLRQIAERVNSGRRRRSAEFDAYYAALGVAVGLDSLRAVSSFGYFENDLRSFMKLLAGEDQ